MSGPTDGPLVGTRVVEVVGIGPGPFACMLLADLGADVIRIDRPGGSETVAPPDRDILGRNRPSVVVDLRQARGVDVLLRLVERADILIEGFRPGVAERLGFGPPVCHERNPALVYGRITGWGQQGPLARSAGHDINYIAVTGALDAIGRAGGPPQVPLNLLGDFAGGSLYLVAGVLAALTHARATGLGQVVDAAITDGVAHLLSMTMSMAQSGRWNPRRGTNLVDSGAPFYDVYRTADDRYMAVGAYEPQFHAELVARLGLGDGLDPRDHRDWPALRTAFTRAFLARTQSEWMSIFEGSDACVAPVVTLADAPAHPHNADRQTYVTEWGITQPMPAPRFSRTPTGLNSPPRQPGADTERALTAWGISDVPELLVAGVVGPAAHDPRRRGRKSDAST